MAKARRFKNRHWPRYVFIHINKTGGSSIEHALSLCFEHKTARQKRAELGERRWREAFKFSFVRNPWDKVASHYFYRVKTNQTGLGDNPIPFNEWVELAYGRRDPRYHDKPRMFMPQSEWLCDEEGRLMVDFVGHFENLESDFAVVCDRIGVNASLPHLKRSGNHDYRRLYDDHTRDIVARVFASDLERFGYSF